MECHFIYLMNVVKSECDAVHILKNHNLPTYPSCE